MFFWAFGLSAKSGRHSRGLLCPILYSVDDDMIRFAGGKILNKFQLLRYVSKSN
jgi:hypothetical protein